MREQEIATQTDAPGSIEAMPEKLVKITPPLSGRITRLQRALGDSVKAGDALFTLDSAELSAAHKDYEAAQAAFEQANSDAQASAAGSRRDYVLRSPFTGTVIEMSGAQGGWYCCA